MSASLKAGLIGAAAAIVLALLGLIPCQGCLSCLLLLAGWALYAGAGALAAFWSDPPRTAGAGAGAGAIAALITAAVGGVVTMIISAARFLISGGAQVATQIPPELMEQFGELGVDLPVGEIAALGASIGGVLAVSSVCCIAGLFLAAALGAIGGAIVAAVKPD
jgi:hypothetical protein